MPCLDAAAPLAPAAGGEVEERLTFDAIFLFDILGTHQGLLVAVVPDGHICTRLGEGLSDGKANAGTGTGNDGRLSLVREERKNLLLCGSGGVVVGEVPTRDSGVCHDGVWNRIIR